RAVRHADAVGDAVSVMIGRGAEMETLVQSALPQGNVVHRGDVGDRAVGRGVEGDAATHRDSLERVVSVGVERVVVELSGLRMAKDAQGSLRRRVEDGLVVHGEVAEPFRSEDIEVTVAARRALLTGAIAGGAGFPAEEGRGFK